MQISLLASFEARPLQPVFDYWLQRLGWECKIEILPAHQLFQQLLAPVSVDGMDIVLARTEDIGLSGQDELEVILSKRARRCLAYVSGGRSPAPSEGVEWLRPELLTFYTPVASAEKASELPFTQEFYAALATALLRSLTPVLVKPLKLLVVDADNTLWDGVVAEDGVAGLGIGAERLHFQAFLKARVQEGYLLAVCSKNAPADVEAVFRDRSEMILRAEHVLAWLVGWDPKSAQILALLQELNLGLESVLVFDDNALEVAELRSTGLQAIQLPEASGIAGLLEHLWWFSSKAVSLEDSRRRLVYRQQLDRNQAWHEVPDPAQFLAGLQLDIRIQPLDPVDLARASQLTYRTNQMHLAARGRAESEFRETLGVWVSDRFGDYGLVGILDFQTRASQVEVETFLLSCRALGRGVEYAMLRHLAGECGSRQLKIRFHASERNRPAARFLERALGYPPQEGWNEFDPGAVRELHWVPEASPPESSPPLSLRGACPELSLVAEQQWRAEDLLAAMRLTGRRLRPRLLTPYVEPNDSRQRLVAEVWAEVLTTEPVGLHDGFFELGGDSLAMLRVLARLQESWGQAPSLDQFLRNPTVSGLAGEPAEQEALPSISWVNDLSDHEVEALLSRLEQPTAIEAVVIPTAGRPQAVARAVASFHGHLRRHGRSTPIVVSDQSSPAQCRETAQLLGQLAADQRMDLHYLGATEQAELREQLVEAGFEPEMVTFTLGGGELQGCGSNRNFLSLVVGATRYLSVDDDTLAAPLVFGELDAPLRFCSGAEAEDVFFFRQPGPPSGDRPDLLTLHESLLGRLRVEFGPGSPQLPRSLANDAWVAATFSGLHGDCGLSAPFGLWEEPIGILGVNEVSRRELLGCEARYREALLSRRHLRLAPVPTLSDGATSLSTFVAVDNTRTLPPWWPALRGTDRLFPVLVSAAHPNALFGHIPVAAPHEPLSERRFSPGELFRNAGGIDLSRLMLEAVGLCQPGSQTDPGERLRSLGKGLEELARGDFVEPLLAQLRRRNDRAAESLLELDGPVWWRADVEEYCRRLRLGQQRPDYWVPLDVQALTSDRAAQRTGRLLRLFGQMLSAWPDLVVAAQDLAKDRPLSHLAI